jgi:hypothetical protein
MRSLVRRHLTARLARATQDGAPTWRDWLKDIALAGTLVLGFLTPFAYFRVIPVPVAIVIWLATVLSRLLVRTNWRVRHHERVEGPVGRPDDGGRRQT